MAIADYLWGLLGLLARDAAPQTPAAPPAPPAPPQADPAALYHSLVGMGALREDNAHPFQLYSTRAATPEDIRRLFAPAQPLPGVVPQGVRAMAMDDINNPMFNYGGFAGLLTEGMAWLGFPYLAELSQRTEYRRISETIAKDMTRRWFRIQAKGKDDKSDKISALEACIKHHKLKEKFTVLALMDGFFGRAHLYLDMGDGDDRVQMKLPLPVDPRMIKRDGLKGIRVVEPMWCYPNMYNANDPLKENFYLPQTWWVMGKEVHRTRLMPFIGREMPDMMKPAYSFGGLSLSQMAKPYVDNWLRTRQSVSDLIHSFSTPVLMTNMGSVMNAGAAQQLKMRAALFNFFRDNSNLMALDKTTEDFKNVSAPLGSLDHLQAQSQEHMASAVGIPLVVLLGISPSGLNATSEGELQVWAQFIHASQGNFFDANLTTILNIMQLSLFGEIDPAITHAWEPLREMSEQEEAAARKSDADLDAVYVNAGVLSPDEIRQKLADESDSPYQGLDLSTPAPPPPNQEPDPLGGMGGGGGPGGPPGGAGGPPGAGGGADPSGLSKPAGGSPNPIPGGPGKMGAAGGSPKAPDPNKGSRDEDANGLAPGESHVLVKPQDPDAHIHVHLGQNDRGHVQLGADAFNPNEPRDASGKFGSGGGKAPATLAHVEAHWDQHGISHHLSENGDTITLSKIALPKEARGQGIGTQAMHSLTAYADANGKTIALTPSTHFGASSVARLTDFYKQFGFTPNKGRKRDFSTTESMLRRPAKQAQDADPEWDESKIKRADNGQFGSGGGAATAKTAKQAKRAEGAKAPKTGGGTSASLSGVSHETNASNADVPAGAVTFSTKKPASGSLHGVAFAPWHDHPTTSEGWQAEADKGPEFEEPAVPELKGGRKQAAGVIVQEPDGRVWTIRPTNAYGGYKASFPKGGVDKDDSLRSTAIKEAFEESGLRVELTGFAGDAQRETSQARYYYARRVGGSPSEHGWESEAVALVPPGELHQHFNKPIDRLIAQHTIEGGDEHHPLDFSKMKKVGGALGSNPGGEYEDPDSGRRFYAKESKSESHAKNELLATRLYEMARSPVLPIMPATVGGKLGTASEWHHGKQNIDIDNKEDRRAAQKNFATHAWLANWDVIGMGQHENDWNQARLDGEMHTLDTGGALLYRAQGGPKGEAFGNEATEWDTLRQKSLAAKVFGEMSPRRLRESAAKVTSIPDHAIRAAVHTHGPGTAAEKDALADKLIARKNDIKKRADALPASDEAIESFAGAADAMIGEWDESAVKRDEGGKFATSASGGGGEALKPKKPVPELTKYAGPAGAKMKKALEEHIASGNDNPHELATLMKTEAGKMKSSNVAGFMNQLIDHLADHHSMPKGALGKAVKMKGGVEGPPDPGAPSEAEMIKMAEQSPFADPLENFQLNPAAPPPTPQGGKVPIAAVHAILTGPGHLQQKIDTLKDLKKAAELQGHDISEATAGLNQLEQEMGESLPPHDGTAVQQEMWEVAAHGHWKTDSKIKQLESDAKGGSGPTRDYAKKLIAAIKGEPPTAEPGTAAQSIAGIEQGIIPPLPAMFKGNGTIVNIHSMADKGFTKSTGLLDYMNKGLASGVIKEGSAEHGYAKAVIMAKVAQENGATPPTPKNTGMKGKVDDIVADPGLTAQQKIDAINYTIIQNTLAPQGHQDYAQIQVNKLKNEVAASWSKPPTPPQGPAPNAKSQHQQNLYDIASGTGTNEEKVEQLKTYPTVVNYPDGYSAKFANSWIKSLGGEPIPGVGFADAATPSVPTPAAPKAAPAAPKAPPSPSKPNSTKHADAEVLAWANKTYNGATQLSSTKSAKARKIAPSLEQKFWDSVDHKAKSATESYCGSGSGSMNGVLRGQIDADTSHAVAPVKAVHSLYKREETKLTEDVVLRRGVGSTTIGKLIPGWLAGLKAGLPCYYNTEGFVSTSMADKAAFSGKPVILEMTCRKGTRALGADTVSGLNENELLLMHGQQFEVYEIVPGAQTTIRMISGKHVEGE